MKIRDCTEAFLEQQMQCAERMLEKHGAAAQEINQNRERLGQRATYLYRDVYYRIDHAEFNDEEFLIISCVDIQKYASIGLMEDVDALPADADEGQIEAFVLRALGLSDQ